MIAIINRNKLHDILSKLTDKGYQIISDNDDDVIVSNKGTTILKYQDSGYQYGVITYEDESLLQ